MANSLVLMAGEEALKEFTPVSGNITITNGIRQMILQAQERFIKPILCKSLYNEILDEIENNNLSPDNDYLLEYYIKPTLAYYTYWLMLPNMWAKTRDAGVVKMEGDSYSQTTSNELIYIREQAKETAYHFGLNLKQYILENLNNYPAYNNDSCKDCDNQVFDTRFFIV